MKSIPNYKLAECESENHDTCYEYDDGVVDLWQCEKCKKNLCYADGAADSNYELCDSCVADMATA